MIALLPAAPGRHGDRADIALVDLPDEFGIRDRLAGRVREPPSIIWTKKHERKQHADPDQQALGPGVAGLLVLVVHLAVFQRRNALVP